MRFESIYYETTNGNCPVKEFIDGLNFKVQQRFFAREETLLSTYGEKLPPPHVHNLREGIYELILSCFGAELRFLFFRISHYVIFVHAFEKKEQKVSDHHIELALRRKRDFGDQRKAGIIKI